LERICPSFELLVGCILLASKVISFTNVSESFSFLFICKKLSFLTKKKIAYSVELGSRVFRAEYIQRGLKTIYSSFCDHLFNFYLHSPWKIKGPFRVARNINFYSGTFVQRLVQTLKVAITNFSSSSFLNKKENYYFKNGCMKTGK